MDRHEFLNGIKPDLLEQIKQFVRNVRVVEKRALEKNSPEIQLFQKVADHLSQNHHEGRPQSQLLGHLVAELQGEDFPTLLQRTKEKVEQKRKRQRKQNI